MTTSQLFLILISGLGVLHGIVFCVFLWNYSKGGLISNKILSILLFVLSLRVGKSVLLYFSNDLSTTIIFLGLSFVLAIGPLFLFYFRAILLRQLPKWNDLFHFIPFLLGILFAFWIDKEIAKSLSIYTAAAFFVFYYGHMLVYLIYGLFRLKTYNKDNPSILTLEWLTIINYALISIWFVYVINIFEDIIPYVCGPIIYSIIVYGITFLAIKKSYLSQSIQKYSTTPISDTELDLLYTSINALFGNQELFKNTNLSLEILSKNLNATPQKISMAINLKSGINFNQFINRFRVNKAKELLLDSKHNHFTIAAIAFEVGFNSINSFNQAFKKETGITPSVFKGK